MSCFNLISRKDEFRRRLFSSIPPELKSQMCTLYAKKEVQHTNDSKQQQTVLNKKLSQVENYIIFLQGNDEITNRIEQKINAGKKPLVNIDVK